MSKLAIFNGNNSVRTDTKEIFAWPIVTKETEDAVLEVLRAHLMSCTGITKRFERGFADWHGVKYGLGCNNGTAALHCAMFGAGIRTGDEIICPAITYWASCLPAFSLGGTVVFADIDPETLCIDPNDIERRVSERTKAILVVHYSGRPAEMDKIMAIAQKHNLKIIEDVSHAHGALYKGRMVGTFGDVSAFSLMTSKAFAIGEGGIMLTDDRLIYERAITFGHYERHAELQSPELTASAGLPWGGYKYRMHQLSAAVGLVQLQKYPREMAEIDKAMNYFWDRLEGTPGIRPHRPPKNSGITMGGWYNALGHYSSKELSGLSITRFCEALRAEGVETSPGCNQALHAHPLFNTVDVYGCGKPTRMAHSNRDLTQPVASLPVAQGIQTKVFSVPWFKRYHKKVLEEYVTAFKKVAENHKELLADDSGDMENNGRWGLYGHLGIKNNQK